MSNRRIVHATIRAGNESGYVAECSDLYAVTQGATLDETVQNLREAVALALDDGDFADAGIDPKPIVSITFDLDLAVA